ncbi:MAG TPA: SH3 domain-containing protein [Chthoniobacterales bacterium]|jgi:hypothetical protein
MKTWVLISCFALMAGSGALAADAKADFDAGKFADAARQLETTVATGQPSAEQFYDLGLAYEKAGEPVSAALNYQRALLLDPGLKPARNSLALLAAAHNVKLPAPSWLSVVSAVAHPDAWIVAGVVAVWLGAFGLLAAFRFPKRTGKIALAVLAIVAGGAAVSVGWLSDVRLGATRPAIVTAKDGAEVLSAPANNSSVVATLPAGSPVGVRSPRGAWAYVDLADGAKGWVQTERLAPIVPGEVF